MAARNPGGEKHACCMRASRPQDLMRPLFSLAGFFRVSLDGPSERGTTRSLFYASQVKLVIFTPVEKVEIRN